MAYGDGLALLDSTGSADNSGGSATLSGTIPDGYTCVVIAWLNQGIATGAAVSDTESLTWTNDQTAFGTLTHGKEIAFFRAHNDTGGSITPTITVSRNPDDNDNGRSIAAAAFIWEGEAAAATNFDEDDVNNASTTVTLPTAPATDSVVIASHLQAGGTTISNPSGFTNYLNFLSYLEGNPLLRRVVLDADTGSPPTAATYTPSGAMTGATAAIIEFAEAAEGGGGSDLLNRQQKLRAGLDLGI